MEFLNLLKLILSPWPRLIPSCINNISNFDAGIALGTDFNWALYFLGMDSSPVWHQHIKCRVPFGRVISKYSSE